MLEPQVRDDEFNHSGKGRLNHVICGNFNPTEWRETFEVWTGENGLWGLTDPATPTYPTGNALDKFLLSPGDLLWGYLLPTGSRFGGEDGEIELDTEYSPSAVGPRNKLSRHNPVSLTLPFTREEAPRREYSLRVSDLSNKELEQKNIFAGYLVKENQQYIAINIENHNILYKLQIGGKN